MSHYKPILYLFVPALFLGASCTNIATNTNEVSNTNENTLPAFTRVDGQTGNVEVVTNTNETVSNENTNTIDTSGEVDLSAEASKEVNTSNWLRYSNDSASLSFLYPEDWNLEHNQDGSDFTDILDNNNIYDHELVNIYVRWSNRHEDIVYDNGVINTSLDEWLSCDYVYDSQSECNTVLINGIEVVKREGQIEPPFGDDYVALAYKQNDFTVVIDARSLLRESSNGVGNNNLDGLKYINAVIKTMSIN